VEKKNGSLDELQVGFMDFLFKDFPSALEWCLITVPPGPFVRVGGSVEQAFKKV